MKFKCWCAYAPSSLGLTTASTHLLAYGLWSALCPTTVLTVSPPSAQSPFAPCRCDPHGGDAASGSSEDITPPSSLLRTHSPVAAASPLLRFWPRWRSLRRLSPVPAARRTFPTLSPRIFPWMLDPIPRRSHSVRLPVSSAVSSAFPTRSWVGFPRIFRLKRLHAGPDFGAADISLCSGLQFCVAPQVVPTAAHTTAGQPGLLRPGRTCFVASARTGYANRPISGN